MLPNQNSQRTVKMYDAKLDKANKPKPPARLVLPKPVRVPPPPNQGNSR